MIRRRFLTGGALCAAGSALARPARAAEFEFKCSSELSADHPSSVRLTAMWSAIEQESGGRIKTQFFPNSQLGNPAAVFSQLRVGAVHFDLLSAGNLSSVVPSFDIVNVGFAFKDSDEALRVFDGALGDYVRAESADKNLHVMAKGWDVGMNQIGSVARPVRVPDDLRGFRIRVSESKLAVELFRALGANPTPLSFNEVYTGLQTRLIDGEAAPMLAIETMRFFEVEKYISMTNHGWGAEFMIANGNVWKSLPPDLRDLVERNHTKAALLGRADAKAAAKTLADRLTRQGLEINALDQAPFRSHLGGYYQEWAAVFGAKAWGLLEAGLGRRLAAGSAG